MPMLTSSDVLKVNNSEELVGLIDEVIHVIPEVNYFGASPVTKNSYKTLCATGLPTVGFRNVGSYRTFDSGSLATKQVDCKYLDASWTIEQALAEQADWGKDFMCAYMAKSHLKAAFFALSKQTWYGSYTDAAGFSGLHEIIDAVVDSNSNKTMVINANAGNVITDASSVFAVRTGLDSIQYAWGSEGRFCEGDVAEQLIHQTNSTTQQLEGKYHYAQKLGGWVGLQVTSRNAAAKIENLSATNGRNGLDDELLYQLLQKFPAGEGPTALFMSRRSLGQLRSSRTATNATGAPAPIPSEFEGIPIFATDAILDNETFSDAGSSSSGS